MVAINKTFWNHYILHPAESKTKKQCVGNLIASIALGIFSLGIVHLAIYLKGRVSKKKEVLEPVRLEEIPNTFEARIAKAKIAVWGASYERSDYERWTHIDSHYIGVGFTAGSEQEIQLDKNPFDANWDEEGTLWATWGSMHKRFTDIYVDRGTIHHLSFPNQDRLIESLSNRLESNGSFWMLAECVTEFGIGPHKMISHTNSHNDRVADKLRALNFKLIETKALPLIVSDKDFLWENWQAPSW